MTDTITLEVSVGAMSAMNDADIQSALDEAGFEMATNPEDGWKLAIPGYPALVCGTVNTLQIRATFSEPRVVTFADSGEPYVAPLPVDEDGRTI